jgi:hypothetical protein
MFDMAYGIRRMLAFTAALRPAMPALPALPAAGPAGLGGVLLRLLIELPLALFRAEVIVLALKLGLCGRLLVVYLHSTNRIRMHCHFFLLELKSLTRFNRARRSYVIIRPVSRVRGVTA